MVIGTASAGGVMARQTVADIITALNANLNVISGLHEKLRDNADIVAAAKRNGRTLFDAREYTQKDPCRQRSQAPGQRLLTMGTDCSVGKMYTTLAIERHAQTRPQGGFPRHRPDRHLHRRRRHTRGCGDRRFHLRSGRVDLAARETTAGISSKARGRCSIRPTPGCRWACSTAPSRTRSCYATN